MDEPLNYCCPDPQGRRRSKRDWKDKSFEDLKNYSHHRDFKLQNFPSHDCPFQNATKQDRKDLRMTTASEQQLETEMQPRKSRKPKSRSPLTFQRNRKHQTHEIPFDPYSQDFETPDLPHCIDRCRGKPLDKLQKKKIKEDMTQDCMETITEVNDIMRIDKKRHKKDKGKLRSQRCLNEIEELKNEICRFECEKMAQGKTFNDQRKRNPLNPKICSKLLRQVDSELDNEEADEENRLLEREIAKISLCEPCTHPKRMVKTPETITSATETSIVEEMDERGQRNIQSSLNDKHLRRIPDDSASSEATVSENDDEREDTLRASPHIDQDSPHYIGYLKNLRWRYLSVIQRDLNRLYELEQVLETLTSKNLKSGEARNPEKGRPVTRTPALR